ncbi:hypothetical protein LUZ60_006352 [Juncus effusus]|nr:hypothetical protein LUZ60_006352 [Juncus effusus]
MESSARRRLESISRHLLLNRLSGNGEEESPGGAPVIVGGMVLDIHARPIVNPDPATTTPGKVKYVNGGVARNVAECMSKLGTKPFIISVVGNDIAGARLMEYWKFAELTTEGILFLNNVTTPVVSNIFDCKGEVIAAVASVDAVEEFLTPDWIDRFHGIISRAPVLMVDANLSIHALEATCKMAAKAGVPIWFEPVSVVKSRRIASISNYVACTTPNETELISMANSLSPNSKFQTTNPKQFQNPNSVQSLFQHLKPAILCLFRHGIKLLIITLGPNGIFLCHPQTLTLPKRQNNSNPNPNSFIQKLSKTLKNTSSSYDGYFTTRSSEFCAFHVPAVKVRKVVGLTGAGDCFVGGLLSGICAGLDVARSCVAGCVAAKFAVECESNVADVLDFDDSVADEARRVLMAVKPLVF